jgi:hypothetical protein
MAAKIILSNLSLLITFRSDDHIIGVISWIPISVSQETIRSGHSFCGATAI